MDELAGVSAGDGPVELRNRHWVLRVGVDYAERLARAAADELQAITGGQNEVAYQLISSSGGFEWN
jgi:hypothetical protein